MAIEYGRTFLSKTGRVVRCIADGDYRRVKSGGISLDMTTVPTNATGSAITLTDDTVVAVGAAYMRFGQIVCRITSSGLFGPYDPAATGTGRESLIRGQCFVLDETWIDGPVLMGQGLGTLHPRVFDGGHVWFERILQVGTGTASLAAGPQLAAFLTAFPEISFVKN